MTALAAAWLVAVSQTPPADPWKVVWSRDGVVVSVQPVSGSGYERIRVTGTTTASPAAYLEALWGKATDSSASPEVVYREVLIDGAAVRRYYDVVHAPPASDRDYVMHETWAVDPTTRAIDMHFSTVEDATKPPVAGRIRFPLVEGSVHIEPLAGPGSAITYTVFTDLGGSLPPWLTRGAQRTAAHSFFLEIRRRAELGQAGPRRE